MRALNAPEMADVAGGVASGDVVESGVFNVVSPRGAGMGRAVLPPMGLDPLMPELTLDEAGV